MRYNILKMAAMAAVLAVFGAAAFAQNGAQKGAQRPDGQDPGAQTQPASSNQPGQPGPLSGMMGMMMNHMMGQNQQMSDNMKRMTEMMAAMQNEKDPTKIKSMMMDQTAMMEQMRGQMMNQGGQMQNMREKMTEMMKTCAPPDDKTTQPAK